MAAPPLSAVAEKQSLIAPAALLDKVQASPMFEPAAPADDALAAPVDPKASLTILLEQMARRGFAPPLVNAMLDRLADRPLARGLFAWDVLVGAILAHDDIELIDELCSAALKVKPWLPPAGVPCLDLDAFRSRELVEGKIDREGIMPFSQLLLRARAYSFAGVYLHHAVTVLGEESARHWACESYVEAGQGGRLPSDLLPAKQADATTSTLELTEYALYRTEIEAGKVFSAFQSLNAANALRGSEPASTLLRMVTNEIAVRFPTAKWSPQPFEWIDEQSRKQPCWAYAGRQRVLTAAAQDREPLVRLAEYLMHFGSDVRVWQHAWRAAGPGKPWRGASGRLLARELAALPHEPSVWSALAIAAGDEQELAATNAELRERLTRQSTL